jgi:formate hydrogenlyase subunit 4
VFSSTSGQIQQLAPTIALASVITAALLVPFHITDSANLPDWLGKAALTVRYDFVIFAYLLALGRFFMIIAAFDAGSSFEGMGANREGYYSLLLEPAFFVIMASLALISGNYSFHSIFLHFGHSNFEFALAALLAVFVFMNLTLVENSRMPVDDPKTHLELTMVHEVMVLDISGYDLALVQITRFIKFAIFGTIIANCLAPSWLNAWGNLAFFVIVQIAFASFIGVFESFRARYRMNKNAQYILAITAVSLIAFILAVILTKNTGINKL